MKVIYVGPNHNQGEGVLNYVLGTRTPFIYVLLTNGIPANFF